MGRDEYGSAFIEVVGIAAGLSMSINGLQMLNEPGILSKAGGVFGAVCGATMAYAIFTNPMRNRSWKYEKYLPDVIITEGLKKASKGIKTLYQRKDNDFNI